MVNNMTMYLEIDQGSWPPVDTTVKQMGSVESERYQSISDLDPVGHVVYLGCHGRAVDVFGVDVELIEGVV